MAKKVLVIDNKRDLLYDHFELFMKSWEEGSIMIKKKPDGTTYAPLSLDPEEYGILWFNSKNYEKFINVADKFVYPDHQRVIALKFNYGLSEEEVIEQARILIEKLQLTNPESVYVKIRATEELDDTIAKLIQKIKSEIPLASRLQLDFADSDISLHKVVKLSSKVVSLGNQNGIRVNGCRAELFNQKNKWIGFEPCVSARTMETLLDTPMVKRPDTSNEGYCMCHKHVNFSGAGELFNPEIHQVRRTKSKKGKAGY